MNIMYINGELLKNMFKLAAAELNKNREIVDALNVFPVPDGDTGTNMSLTMNAAVLEVDKVTSNSAAEVAKAMAKGSLMGARGNSGVILSQIFRGFAKGCEDKQHLSSVDLAKAMKEASDTAYKAVMKPVEGTILTVIRKTGEKAMDYTEDEVAIDELMKILIRKAEDTLDKTPEYLEVLRQAGVVDAGGKGLVCILKGFYSAILGKEIETETVTMPFGTKMNEAVLSEHAAARAQGEIKFGYCTEFILQTKTSEVGKLKEIIQTLGDSMVFVQDEDIVKIHIHTNNPGEALESALEHGELLNIKIENMRQQHSAILENEGVAPMVNGKTVDEKDFSIEKLEKYGFVSVSMGEGLSSIFSDLGVDFIIEGGQTMNPSTEDIMKAIDSCKAENIFILPNNSNIILAANQAKSLSEKNVHVIPTKTVPQGIAAMIEFDANSEMDENEEAMTAAVKNVKTVQVTYSVRDTVFNELEIKKDDILGISEGEITSVGQSIDSVSIEALKQAVNEDSEILTVYFGEDIPEEDAEKLKSKLEELFEDLEIEVYYGGQPIYYYIFSVE